MVKRLKSCCAARNAAAGTGMSVAIAARGASTPVKTDSNAARAEFALLSAIAGVARAAGGSLAPPLPDTDR